MMTAQRTGQNRGGQHEILGQSGRLKLIIQLWLINNAICMSDNSETGLYFFIAAQSVHVAQPMLFKWTGQYSLSVMHLNTQHT